MRRAMAAAEVGDDVYGEDPSVNALEERVAAMFGHEAAVFVPSGTMGNQICIRLLVPPAGELLCDGDAHIVTYEGGGAAQHGGIQTRTVAGPVLDVAAYRSSCVRPVGARCQRARLPSSRPTTAAAGWSTTSAALERLRAGIDCSRRRHHAAL